MTITKHMRGGGHPYNNETGLNNSNEYTNEVGSKLYHIECICFSPKKKGCSRAENCNLIYEDRKESSLN